MTFLGNTSAAKAISMTPSDAMQAVLNRVEAVTGYPVHLQADASIRTMAVAKPASDSIPVNIIRYRPDVAADREYLVCFQCGFVLRLFSLPKDQRWDIADDERGRYQVGKLAKEHLRKSTKSGAPDSVIATLTNQFLGGLITQLRSVPLGLRIDQWLIREFPSLIDQQTQSIDRQLNENSAILGPNVRQIVPAKIFSASAAMNSAFACFWSRVRSDPLLEVPYKAAGFLDAGKRLLAIFDQTADAPENDRALIDAWANDLELVGWFKYVSRQ